MIREILANHLIKSTVNNLTDPDYFNQTILYICQDDIAPKTENFLITLSHSESLDELREIRDKIDEEILNTRSYDKGKFKLLFQIQNYYYNIHLNLIGGQNDQEIKQRLSSLQYIKRKIENYILNLFNINNKINSTSPKKSKNQKSHTENDTRLFQQQLNLLDFKTVCTNETIQHCFIEYMSKQNVQNLISFYLNADMYRQFAIKELNRNQDQDELEVKGALKDFANGLINSYLLSADNFRASVQDDDDQPINIANRIFYKSELIKTVEHLEMNEHLNESLLDDLQDKIHLLMKQKYYPDFKNYPEFHKILLKNDLLFKLTSNDVTQSVIMAGEQHYLPRSKSQPYEMNQMNEDDDFTSTVHYSGLNDYIDEGNE